MQRLVFLVFLSFLIFMGCENAPNNGSKPSGPVNETSQKTEQVKKTVEERISKVDKMVGLSNEQKEEIRRLAGETDLNNLVKRKELLKGILSTVLTADQLAELKQLKEKKD